jgi:diaminopimelate decarboxylase
VVGPICESGDYLAQDRKMPLPRKGELLAVHSAGAYGMVMASNYNQRGRAAEVLVLGKKAWVTRQRETWDDLLRGESVPAALKARRQAGGAS